MLGHSDGNATSADTHENCHVIAVRMY